MKFLLFALFLIVPVFSLGFMFSVALRKYKNRLEEKALEKVRAERITKIPTVRLADELFEREEAWDIIAEQAIKENTKK